MPTPREALRTVGRELDQTVHGLDGPRLDRVRAALELPGRRWFVAGQGRSGLVAAMIAMRLMHLGGEAHLVGEATAPSIRRGDGLLALSKSGATPTTVAQARIARGEDAVVVAVTAAPASPLAATADEALILGADPSAQFGGSRFEQSALIVLDALMLSLGPGEADQRRMRHRHSNLH